jgi:hypothetical protein
LEVGVIMVRYGGLHSPVAPTVTSGGQFANCSWPLRTVPEVDHESRQARHLPGGEIESSLFARHPFSKMKSQAFVMIGNNDHDIPAVEPRVRS